MKLKQTKELFWKFCLIKISGILELKAQLRKKKRFAKSLTVSIRKETAEGSQISQAVNTSEKSRTRTQVQELDIGLEIISTTPIEATVPLHE